MSKIEVINGDSLKIVRGLPKEPTLEERLRGAFARTF